MFSPPSRSVATRTPGRSVELGHELDLPLGHRADHQLRNPGQRLHHEGFCSVVDEDDANLPSIVGVDGPRAVEHREPVLQCQPRARSDLSLEAGGNAHGQPRGDEAAFSRCNRDGVSQGGGQIQPRAPAALVSRHRNWDGSHW